MKKTKYEFWITVNNRPVDEYSHEGDTYIEGRKGSEYTINFRNNFFKPLKVVFSVDGLNIISGNNDFNKGYVVNPHELLTIPGWLSSDSTAQKFVFSSKDGSYNMHNKSGDSANIGVIGAMVYDVDNRSELIPRTVLWHDTPTILRGVFYSSDTTAQVFAEQNIGTGYGDETQFNTVTVNKKFLPQPSETLAIYYDSKKGLEKRGIILKPVFTKPNPFPGIYCPKPIDK